MCGYPTFHPVVHSESNVIPFFGHLRMLSNNLLLFPVSFILSCVEFFACCCVYERYGKVDWIGLDWIEKVDFAGEYRRGGVDVGGGINSSIDSSLNADVVTKLSSDIFIGYFALPTYVV